MKGKKVLAGIVTALLLLNSLPAHAADSIGGQVSNLSAGKSVDVKYLANMESACWMDPVDDKTTFNLLTDGAYGNASTWDESNSSQKTWVRFNRSTGRQVIVNLGQTDSITSISMEFANKPSKSIAAPYFVKYYISSDGKNYTYVGQAKPDKNLCVLSKDANTGNGVDSIVYKLNKTPDGEAMNYQGSYVMAEFNVDVAALASEIEVDGFNGIKNGAVVPKYMDDNAAYNVNKYPSKGSKEASKIGDQFLLYTGQIKDAKYSEYSNWNKDKAETIIGYRDKNGEIKDWFYDDILIMPQGNNYLNYPLTTKENWQHFADFIFDKDMQLGAINSAAEEINSKFNTNKKIKVQIAIPSIDNTLSKFGDLYGKGVIDSLAMNDHSTETAVQKTLDNRLSAIKWYIDYIDSKIKSLNYKNIDFTGFYCYNEQVYSYNGDDILLQNVSKYLTSKNYNFTWIPYMGTSSSPYLWKYFGFTSAALQPNYAFVGDTGAGYRKSVLALNADVTKKYGMGDEIEYGYGSKDPTLKNDLPAVMARFSEYLNYGLETGYMNDSYHAYYLNTTSFIDMANALNPDYNYTDPGYANIYINSSNPSLGPSPMLRAAYDRLYEFVKGKYTQKRFATDLKSVSVDTKNNVTYKHIDTTDLKNITVPLSIIDADDFVSGKLYVYYDSTKVKFNNAVSGTAIKDIGKISVDSSIPGFLTIDFNVNDKNNPVSSSFTKLPPPPNNWRSGKLDMLSEIAELSFSALDGVAASSIDRSTFVIGNAGDATDIKGVTYLNWSESAVINDTLASGINAKAEGLIKTAETSKLQKDIDSAMAILNIMPDGTIKCALTKRLNAVTDYNKLKSDADAKVSAYEKLANGDLSTQEKIDAANSAKAAIVLDGLNDTDKADFMARIQVADVKVTAAVSYNKLKSDADAKISAYEKLANGDLSTQEKIDAANNAKAAIVLDGLNDTDKADFAARIKTADNAIALAQSKLSSKTTQTADNTKKAMPKTGSPIDSKELLGLGLLLIAAGCMVKKKNR